MGMTLTVRCPNGVPAWPAVSAWLVQRGCAAQMRMIDGQLAFPDEEPLADWHELRVSLQGGMLTLRREPNAVQVVAWGNADAVMQRDWKLLAEAVAAVVNGTVQNDSGD